MHLSIYANYAFMHVYARINVYAPIAIVWAHRFIGNLKLTDILLIYLLVIKNQNHIIYIHTNKIQAHTYC